MTQEELLRVIEQAAREGTTRLDLSGNQLTALPPEIGMLTQLKTLILGKYQGTKGGINTLGNNLSTLPAEIGQLSHLKHLRVIDNRLSRLPPEIGQLTSLRSLHLRNNQLSSVPPEIFQLTNLRSLHLSGNQLSSVPSEILQLTNLRSLSLWGNQLSGLPPEILQLTNLRWLNLGDSQLSSVPPEIVQLTNLQMLDLWGNQLSSVPSEILQLTNLRSLNLNRNQLSSVPPEILQLTNLRSLDLGSNQLSSVPSEILQLTNLRSLNLVSNQLSNVPPEILQLTNLQMLDLWGNQLSSVPPEILQLTNLRTLYIGGSQLSSVPPEILQLTNLQTLYIGGSQLSSLPSEIFQLLNLQTLYLRGNQLSSLPSEIGQLTNLRSLDLSDNQLSSLPPEIRQLPNLKKLDLRGNPIHIQPEILGPKDLSEDPGDIDAILDFYFRVQDPTETEALYEAKLLIVGEGGAGKTSFAQKIQDEGYELQDNEKSTQGIDVKGFHFTLPNGQDFRINIWDFGGQEIYHHTHQFFLTNRSLYALVADTRQENTDFYYWLKVIELLSDSSPVLIIKNEKQDRQCEVNDRQLRGEFANLKETLATNLATNRGLPEIKSIIQDYVSRLPHVGTPLPKLWVRVRAALENYSRNYISLEEYCRLCQINGLTDRKEMLRLSSYLHDLGVCLHFQSDPLLRHTVILNPEWGTSAVYKVLDNNTVKQNLGCFTQDDLVDIWEAGEYADLRDDLLHLMMRFKLCYEIPHRPHTYIAPNLLSINQPDYTWEDTGNLILRYEYDFMPKGILTRLIVEMYPWIEQQTFVWKTGVILHKDQTRAEVIEHYNQREIKIRVAGNRKRELLAVITHELEKIHQSYERLQYRTLVPCNCESCKGIQTPHVYPLDVLHKFLNARQYQIQCQNSFQMVEVRRLMDDVLLQPFGTELGTERELDPRLERLQRELQQTKQALTRPNFQPAMPEPITRNQVFISYSHQDQEWLTQLQIHLKPMIRNQTLDVWDDTKINPGAEWRTEIETALISAKVAVLLVSPTFLASDFIDKNELPPLLDTAQAKGLTIIWIPLTYCLYEETPIEKYQAAHPPNQPLDSLTSADQNRAWVDICKKIKAASLLLSP